MKKKELLERIQEQNEIVCKLAVRVAKLTEDLANLREQNAHQDTIILETSNSAKNALDYTGSHEAHLNDLDYKTQRLEQVLRMNLANRDSDRMRMLEHDFKVLRTAIESHIENTAQEVKLSFDGTNPALGKEIGDGTVLHN